jgi:tRNA pseudouridine(55) synthase
MASGKLLVLIGEECKRQAEYHNLDKEYKVTILFGLQSDSGDILGIIKSDITRTIKEELIEEILNNLVGEIELPYPVFSAKTVGGKPLHTWAMENRLDEISIPTKTSEIYSLVLDKVSTTTRQKITRAALQKIALLPPVTDPRKALGNDFRRPEVLASWQKFAAEGSVDDQFFLADITCRCSSGTYMRTLAEIIAKKAGTTGLAFSIHRSVIGLFNKENRGWKKVF